MRRQAFRDAATAAALLMALFGAPLAAEAVCQWAGATDPTLAQLQTTIGADRP